MLSQCSLLCYNVVWAIDVSGVGLVIIGPLEQREVDRLKATLIAPAQCSSDGPTRGGAGVSTGGLKVDHVATGQFELAQAVTELQRLG